MQTPPTIKAFPVFPSFRLGRRDLPTYINPIQNNPSDNLSGVNFAIVARTPGLKGNLAMGVEEKKHMLGTKRSTIYHLPPLF